jgi:ElaB/YqjD/DUF883 family membrane-anchored ribosome-binding protein
MSDTPRTDALHYAQLKANLDISASLHETDNFARTLERENAQLRAEVESLRKGSAKACGDLRTEVERLRDDRDCEKRLRKDSDDLATDWRERAERAEAFIREYVEAWDEGLAGDSYMHRKALAAIDAAKGAK